MRQRVRRCLSDCQLWDQQESTTTKKQFNKTGIFIKIDLSQSHSPFFGAHRVTLRKTGQLEWDFAHNQTYGTSARGFQLRLQSNKQTREYYNFLMRLSVSCLFRFLSHFGFLFYYKEEEIQPLVRKWLRYSDGMSRYFQRQFVFMLIWGREDEDSVAFSYFTELLSSWELSWAELTLRFMLLLFLCGRTAADGEMPLRHWPDYKSMKSFIIS